MIPPVMSNKPTGEDVLPDINSVEQRLADIQERINAREAVARLADEKKWDEALQKAQEAGLSFTEFPVFLSYIGVEKSKVDLMLNDVKAQLLKAQDTLAQTKETLAQTNRIVMEQEMIAACFRADEALKASNLANLGLAIVDLEGFQRDEELKQVLPSWFITRLDALKNDHTWIQGNLQNEKPSSSNWLEHADNWPTGTKSRIAVLRGQKSHNSDEKVVTLSDLENLEKDLSEGKIDDVESRLKELENKQRDGLEQLAIENHIAIFRHYISGYMLAKGSLSDARDRLKEAKSYRGKSEMAKALYAREIFSEIKRLKRDLLMLPAMVQNAHLATQEVSRVTSSHANTTALSLPQGSNPHEQTKPKWWQFWRNGQRKKENSTPANLRETLHDEDRDSLTLEGTSSVSVFGGGVGKDQLSVRTAYEQIIKEMEAFGWGK